jgi:hypothetical protein
VELFILILYCFLICFCCLCSLIAHWA